MKPSPRSFLRLFTALTALLAIALASGQVSLLKLADPDALVAVRLHVGDDVTSELRQELAQLDWQGGSHTLDALLSGGLAASEAMTVLGPLSTLLAGSGGTAGLEDLAAHNCSAFEAPLRAVSSRDGLLPRLDALLTIGDTRSDHAVTLVTMLDGPSPAVLRMLRMALHSCASEESREARTEGGEPIDLFRLGSGDGSLLAHLANDGLFIVSSDAEAVARVVERRTVGDAPSLADYDPFSRLETVHENGSSLAVALRPAAMAESVSMLLGNLGSVATSQDLLIQRAREALLTMESLSLQWSLTGEGIVSESALVVDSSGPDSELARLLLCGDCEIARPFLVPAQAYSVASAQLPLTELLAYLEPLIATAGGPADLSSSLQESTGIDLEADLLDWLGSQAHMAVLEPHGTDLRTLLFQPGNLLLIPVSSPEEAAAGLERLELALLSHWEENGDPFLPIALRNYSYRGVDYRRVQSSLNLDVGVAVVGNHLLVAMPANAIESVIDVYKGAPSMVGWAAYRNALSAAPSDSRALSLQDTSAQLKGLASLLDLLSQPVAFALQTVIASESSFEPTTVPLWPVDIEGRLTRPLARGSVNGELTDGSYGQQADQIVDDSLSDLYRLEDLTAGDTVTVVMESSGFDTLLQLIEVNSGFVVDYNDDAPDTTRSEIVFEVEPNSAYVVQATSFDGFATGEYLLTVERSGAREQEENPDFSATLELLELPAQALEILADYVGYSRSYTVTEDSTVYSRSVTEWSR